MIWTRLAPDPLAGGGMPPQNVEVDWAVAEDASFRRIVRQGRTLAEPAWAHSVHVEVEGLNPDRWYWYRFRAPRRREPGGPRAHHAAPGAGETLRFVFASCQRWEFGHYAAWRHAANASPDLIVHLGDYIYEGQLRSGANYIRTHDAGEAVTLADYRNRYALYKLEPELQAAHAACPWIVTWDDHEVVNDYANDHPTSTGSEPTVPRSPRRRLQGLLRAHAAASRRSGHRAPIFRSIARSSTALSPAFI